MIKTFLISILLCCTLAYAGEEIVDFKEESIPTLNEELRSLDIDEQIMQDGKLDLHTKKIENLATPTATTDATTKAYVDAKVAAAVAALTIIEVVTGTYAGTGIDDKEITIGFTDTTKTPIMVIVREKSGAANTYAQFRCNQDDADRSWQGSQQGYNVGDMGNKIQSFGVNKFVVGTNAAVNADGETYEFIAIG